jgi:hypothetical protein
MHNYKGDILAGATIRGTFNTRDTDAAPITLASGTLRVYKDDGTTEDDSGITLNTDFDGRTGLHLWEVDTSADGTFYSAGSDFFVVLTVGTVDSISVVGTCVGHFSIENRNIKANVTQFGGSALTSASGIPEVKVASIAANAITATAIASDAITDAKVASDVTIASVTGAVGSVTGAVGSVTGSVGSVATGGITAASFAADAITAAKIAADVTTEIQAGLATASSITALDGKIDTIDSNVDAILVDTAEIGAAGAGLTNINLPNQTMDIVGNITGNLSGSVGSVTGAVGSVTGAVGSVTGLTASDVGAIKAETDKLADTLEDDAGTYRFTTNALEQAPTGGGAADGSGFTAIPWNASWDAEVQSEVTDALNAYDPPTKAELDSAVAPLATAAALTIVDDFLDTEVAAIKAKTDNLPSDPADQSAVEAAITAAQLTAAGVRSAVGLASANLDTQLDSLPTNAELTTALGTADDAVLAAIAALNNLSAAQVASALNTYDAPTKAEFDAAVALLATAANLALVPAAVLTAADANPIAANVQEINDVALTGDGNSTPWGPAA